MADNHGVFRWAGGDGELDLGVGGGEFRELRLDEAAVKNKESETRRFLDPGTLIDILHALGAAGPVAVVKVHLLALEDKGAEAILSPSSAFHAGQWCVCVYLGFGGHKSGLLTRPVDTVFNAWIVMMCAACVAYRLRLLGWSASQESRVCYSSPTERAAGNFLARGRNA